MKTYLRGHSISIDEVEDAFLAWSKSKSGRKNMHIVIENYGCGTALISEIHSEIESRSLTFIPIRYYERVEPTNGKVRTIGVQSVKQQVCDYMAVRLLQPLIDARLGYYQCASVPEKGQVFAMRSLRRWYDEGGYFVKMDVRKCYPSVDQEVLMAFLRKRVGSQDLLYVCESLLSTYGKGLNIGSYFSQYMANLVLSQAYHFVESLSKERRGASVQLVTHQLWYMDDCVMLSRSKRDLTMAATRLERYLADALHLSVKFWKVCRVGRDTLDMVGFRITHGLVRLRKSTFKRARRAFARFARAPCMRRAFRVVSYWGFLKWTDGAFCSRHGKAFKDARAFVSGRSKLCA